MVWQLKSGQTGVDIVAIGMTTVPDSVWLIEAKDFRTIRGAPKTSNIQGLAQSVRRKVVDTLAGLQNAAAYAIDPGEKQHASSAITANHRRVVLHLEPYAGAHTKLFPLNFSVGVLQKLKQLVKDIDPKPLVLNIANTSRAGVPWSVA